MPKLGHIADINPEADYGRRCNPDGSCSGCGECCNDFLPLSKDELKRIKAYAKKNGLKPHWNSVARMILPAHSVTIRKGGVISTTSDQRFAGVSSAPRALMTPRTAENFLRGAETFVQCGMKFSVNAATWRYLATVCK